MCICVYIYVYMYVLCYINVYIYIHNMYFIYVYFSEAICGSVRATRPQQRARISLPISFSGSRGPIVPDFLPTVKEPVRI